MSRDYSLYLEDMLESCLRITRYTKGLSFDHFINNEMVYDAVLRNIEIIGEAVKHIPFDFREKYPEMEWRRISGMRDIVAHHYFSIQNDIVWDIIIHKIPDLIPRINEVLAEINTNT
jgi:uncharacterized protein with HEPN domain